MTEAASEGERWVLATDAPEQTLRALLAEDALVSRLEVSPMPFEEAFLSLTGDSQPSDLNPTVVSTKGAAL